MNVHRIWTWKVQIYQTLMSAVCFKCLCRISDNGVKEMNPAVLYLDTLQPTFCLGLTYLAELTNPLRTTLIGQKIEDQIKYHH